MSGITPIIDTLLHQVLGKRVDIPVPRDLNQPVGPAVHPEGLRQVRGDARLDSRQPAALELPAVSRHASPPDSRDLAPRAEAGAASVHTRLSPVARIIAGLLARFPSPPSVIQTAAPLLPGGDAAPASLLASQLQASISDSGLFYESHLARWYRGEMPRQQLEREPQMRVAAPPGPAAAASVAGAAPPVAVPGSALAAAGTPATPIPSPIPAAAGGAERSPPPSPPAAPQVAAPLASAAQGGALPAGSNPWAAELAQTHTFKTSDDNAQAPPAARALDIADGLQGVVRHQLEVLAAPVLRWEGDLWAGIFVALVIQAPDAFRDHRHESGDEGEENSDEGAWQSELTMHLENLGPLGVRLRLAGASLSLAIDTVSTAVVERLEAGRPALLSRLEARGFSEPVIDIRLDTGGDNDR